MTALRLTNKTNLPQPIVDAIRNDPYSKGNASISVTELIGPPRIVALKETFSEKIEEDASDRIWSLVGQVMHSILERADRTAITERRLFMESSGWTVSGSMDRFVDGLLQDYKFVSAYKFKDNTVPLEYEQQLNCYAEILRKNGQPVVKMELIAILRDWSKLGAKRSADYPQTQALVLPVPLWSEEKASAFIRERVILHQQARISLPECSSEERWEKPAVYAVMRPGRKSALKLYDTEQEADDHASKERGLYVIHRPGESTRCLSYCPVSSFCEQFKKMNSEE